MFGIKKRPKKNNIIKDVDAVEETPEQGEQTLPPFNLADYEGHIALGARDRGCSGVLLGNVCIVAFLVQEQGSAWEDVDIEKMKQVLIEAADMIKKQSGFPDKKLKVSYAFDTVLVQMKYDRDSNYRKVESDVLQQYGYSTAAQYQAHYEQKFKKSEAPIVFVFNKNFRSFAGMSREKEKNPNSDEYSFVAFSGNIHECARTLVHELMHQFGAIDYYLPDKVKQTAQKLFPDSIMSSGTTIDSLTRYLIGWDEEPDASAVQFLNETKDVTDEDVSEARKKDSENDW